MENLKNSGLAEAQQAKLSEALKKTEVKKVMEAVEKVTDLNDLNAIGHLIALRYRTIEGTQDEPMFTPAIPDSLKAPEPHQHNLNWYSPGG